MVSVIMQYNVPSSKFYEKLHRIAVFFCKIIFFFDLVPPSIMPFNFGDESFNTGDVTGVQCMAMKGDLPMRISWMLNGNDLKNGDYGISIMNNQRKSILDIPSLDQSHRGVYKCIVINQAGSTEYSSELHVNGICIEKFND